MLSILLFALLAAAAAPPAASVPVPASYAIGTDDVLEIVFWKDKDLSVDVVVRPDGLISLPLLNDVHAAGLTPEQLRQQLTKAAGEFLESPSVTVLVKQINSRKVFITGQVDKPGMYGLTTPMTVLQLIAAAGGLKEDADRDHIVVMRRDPAAGPPLAFNYDEVVKGKRLPQNVVLLPGDTVVIP